MRMRQLFGARAKRKIFQRGCTAICRPDKVGARRRRLSALSVVGLRFLLLGTLLFLTVGKAEAVPAFAAQTGLACTACHVGGFGPQLTPLGREFKLEGYTMRSGDDFTLPLSVMAISSYLQTAKSTNFAPAPGFGTNDNAALDKLSAFLAGGYGDHFGGLAQFTYYGVGSAPTWDVLDLRTVDHITVDGQDVLIGLSLNNNPSVEDPWNTLPAWGFPYTSTALAPSPGTIPVIGALAQTVVGMDAYAWWNSSIYTEAGLYMDPGQGFLAKVGDVSSVANELAGPAPYLRAAYQKDYDEQNFEIGAFGFFPRLRGSYVITGESNDFRDLGVDASYQFTGTGANIYQVNAAYTDEHQSRNASSLLQASNQNDTLQEFRVDASYYWQNMVGGTIQHFDTWGSPDRLLYAGDANFRPNSSGFMFQVDATLFGGAPLEGRFNVRVGLQYTAYTEFNGAVVNYNGLDRNAADNNAFRVFIWSAM